ncbi:MAG: hypothetical protein FWC42_03120 [Proteobacteria bacterium]|nr:hypothetical protein [Pseudomonadota bacterium]
MYDTLIMLKPDAAFTVDELHALVVEMMESGEATVEREGDHVRVTSESGALDIAWNNAAHVAEESNEIAERFNVPSQGCSSRFEIIGDDPDMDLFDDYLLINERLQGAGKFVIFDTQECTLLFE